MVSFRDSWFWGFLLLLLLIPAAASASWVNTQKLGTFGLDIHHRYSDTVRAFFGVDGLPEKGTVDYFAAMAHRDNLFHSRRLAAAPSSSGRLTFLDSNQTFRISALGFLHYALVTVGTPPYVFLVALDTGSDLFWLPCECQNCVRSLTTPSGKQIKLNSYSPNTSSTSEPVACNTATCGQRRCSRRFNACVYQAVYLSANTSTTGILVDDILHLGTDSHPQKPVNVPITLGCGINQTGDFVDGAAINGLFGLGMNNLSVPSILANKGLTANSFSMCFGRNGTGRIDFGDKGSPDQKVTSFNLQQSHPSYNVTVTQIAVGDNITNLEFTAIFDSGTSFAYLTDPAYSAIAESYNRQITDQRYQSPSKIFEYCYALDVGQNNLSIPNLNFTMKGGNQYDVHSPFVIIPQEGGYVYCLAIVKSRDIDIIGQNFMTGYRIVFDREEMVLGWKESDCYTTTSSAVSVNKQNNTEAPSPSPSPSPSVLNPETRPRNGSPMPTPSSPLARPLPPVSQLPSGSNAGARLDHRAAGILTLVFSIFFHHFVFSSSGISSFSLP